MIKRVSRVLLPLLLALTTMALAAAPAMAATSAPNTGSYTPAYVGCTSSGGPWSMGTVAASTTYYSNPLGYTTSPSSTVAVGECLITVNNLCTVNADFFADLSDTSGGSDNMTNGNTGSAGATSLGAYSYYQGMTFSNKVVAKSSGSTVLYSNVAPATASFKMGYQMSTQTNAWVSSGGCVASSFTMTIRVAAH